MEGNFLFYDKDGNYITAGEAAADTFVKANKLNPAKENKLCESGSLYHETMSLPWPDSEIS